MLSGGADTQLKIWSVETGQSAATLLGHTAGKDVLTHTHLKKFQYQGLERTSLGALDN